LIRLNYYVMYILLLLIMYKMYINYLILIDLFILSDKYKKFTYTYFVCEHILILVAFSMLKFDLTEIRKSLSKLN